MRIVIVGAGGHARVVLESLLATGEHEVAGLTDTDESLWMQRYHGYAVLGDDSVLASLYTQGVTGAIVAMGNNRLRLRLAAQLEQMGFALVNALHPRAWVSPSAHVGKGVAIMAGAVVQAGACIGSSAIINTGSTVDHDCILEEGVHIAPGSHLCGTVSVGTSAFVGAGATVIPGITIGADATIGAGAVVLHNVAPTTTVVGVPARKIKEWE